MEVGYSVNIGKQWNEAVWGAVKRVGNLSKDIVKRVERT